MLHVPYASVVGKIMYTMVCTRLDMSHTINVVSRYMDHPRKIHWQAVKWILPYLRGTSHVGLAYDKSRDIYGKLLVIFILIMLEIWIEENL